MMTEVTIPVAEHLYDERAQLTSFTEYGTSFQELMSGQVGPPPEGARFDVAFEGTIEGEKVKGEISGVDYAEVRADGRFQLHIHAEITTDDEEKISFFADGILIPPEDDTGIAGLRYNVRLTTSSSKYSWVNKVQVWVRGSVNLSSGEINVKAYAA